MTTEYTQNIGYKSDVSKHLPQKAKDYFFTLMNNLPVLCPPRDLALADIIIKDDRIRLREKTCSGFFDILDIYPTEDEVKIKGTPWRYGILSYGKRVCGVFPYSKVFDTNGNEVKMIVELSKSL